MEGHHLKCVNASDSNYLHSIERAIRIGEAVLLQVVLLYPFYLIMSMLPESQNHKTLKHLCK